MAVTSGLYGIPLCDIMAGTFGLTNGNFHAILLTGYTASTATHHYRSDIGSGGGVEVSGVGYTATGCTVTGATLSFDSTSHEARWSFANPTWTQASFTAQGMVIYKANGGTSSADQLIQWVDFGGANTVTLGTFTYQVPATGSLVVTIS